MNKNKILIWLLVIIVVLAFTLGKSPEISEIEDKEISAGIGTDLIKEGKDNYRYAISDNVYFFIEDKEVTSDVFTGTANTIGGARDNRATKLPKEFFLGQSKVFIMSEFLASKSIRPTIEILFNNPNINDNAYCVISKGSTKSKIDYKIQGFSSASEYIEGMIKHMENYSFFRNQYKVRDVFLTLDSEGRCCILPCIDLDNEGLKIVGVAIFDKDKLAQIMDMNDTIILNILRNKSGKGILSIRKNDKEYIDYYAKSKKKVKCIKKDGKYSFNIDISFNGDIINNTLYKDIDKDKEVVKRFEDDMKMEIENLCNSFFYKMKKTSGVDCLELGRLAAAKYGRNTGVNWNEVVCNSEIKVNIKVKVDKVGRGQY